MRITFNDVTGVEPALPALYKKNDRVYLVSKIDELDHTCKAVILHSPKLSEIGNSDNFLSLDNLIALPVGYKITFEQTA